MNYDKTKSNTKDMSVGVRWRGRNNLIQCCRSINTRVHLTENLLQYTNLIMKST